MEELEQAVAALIEYGYTHEADGSLVRYKAGSPRDKWEPVPEESFLRFTRVDGQWQPVPYTIAAAFAGVSGLSADKHPECFDFHYPADYVLNIYATAVQDRG